ncbi:hypothetical protein KKR91_07725 [Arthrobacter jiangjiafuii]|uniref:TIGR02391 family protein n=1 Tax=Arthrobacter jiangjiafuii TaxID=2817475 RepID=A0A975M8L5_9MICC|nr:hypothetical protein [Arthrobacter jiangjiafuii]MBP3042894.1 hypothetical protein [Arthrobacter jiangjiafuii]QWC11426.1 hypothetical protein KKR91_07725 [Arthrobacter jiangjiafuii]
MTESVDNRWLPLGVDTEEQVAEYDALHDGLPAWMTTPFWLWVQESVTVYGSYRDGSGRFQVLDEQLVEEMCQTLGIVTPNLRRPSMSSDAGATQLFLAMQVLRKHSAPLQIADYLLAFNGHADASQLDALLQRSRSLYEVGTRGERSGLVRRVPLGVKDNADALFIRAGQAGVRLAKAWEALYGVSPDASKAYALAIKSVEDAAIPLVSPSNSRATLGTLIGQMRDQRTWSLPMARENDETKSGDVILGMMRLLWNGQHDRHGGQPSAPGDVSFDEAQVAVSLAVNLVQLFNAGLVQRI